MSLCRNQKLPKIPNPVEVCQQVYGQNNVNDVRDCLMNSIRRYYGFMCDFCQKKLYHTIQLYLIKILENAGRNPKAVKLPISPGKIEADFFVRRYLENDFDKKKAYNMCIQDCNQLGNGIRQQCKINCFIDSKSI